MKKKLNEAAVNIDIAGLESSDLQTLSQILALAGQAEQSKGAAGGMGMQPLQPMDFDSIGGDEDGLPGETQPIMDPQSAMGVPSPADGSDELSGAIDDLAGTVSDFGADSEDDVGLDLDVDMSAEPDMMGAPDVEADDEISLGMMDQPEVEDDMFEAFSLKGLLRSVSSILESEEVDDVEEEDEAEEAEDDEQIDESLLPDLSLDKNLDENDESVEGNPSMEAERQHGPYRSEAGARDDAEAAVGGDFVIIPSNDGYYWKHQEADTSGAHGPYQSEAGARDDAEASTGGLNFMIYRRPDGYYWGDNSQQVHEDRRDFGDTEHVVDSKEHGPFRSHNAAVHDAMKLTNGVEYEHFVVIPGADGFYWRRNLEEDLDNEPELQPYDNDGIENSRHAYEPKRPGTALGDNPLGEACDDDEDESVEDIYESLQRKYNSFLGK